MTVRRSTDCTPRESTRAASRRGATRAGSRRRSCRASQRQRTLSAELADLLAADGKGTPAGVARQRRGADLRDDQLQLALLELVPDLWQLARRFTECVTRGRPDEEEVGFAVGHRARSLDDRSSNAGSRTKAG